MLFINLILLFLSIDEALSWKIITKNKNTMDVNSVWAWKKRLQITVHIGQMAIANTTPELQIAFGKDDCLTAKKQYLAYDGEIQPRFKSYEIVIKDT